MEQHSEGLKVMVIDDSKTIRRTAETLLGGLHRRAFAAGQRHQCRKTEPAGDGRGTTGAHGLTPWRVAGSTTVPSTAG